ncbi:MAG: MarR family transcriptional regulator [Haliscomenobacter sp.]|nr:MarR family transcriptional regulator [Haliscomenobacter sp.]
MQLNQMTDHRIEQQYAFLMEQIIKRYRQAAAHALNAHQAGISVDQWVVLKQISEHHGCSQVEIALSTVKDAPTTTRIIDQLTKKELIGKQLDPSDRRRYMVFVTPKGQRLIERLLPVVREYRKIAVRDFTSQEMDLLQGMLHRMVGNLGD